MFVQDQWFDMENVWENCTNLGLSSWSWTPSRGRKNFLCLWLTSVQSAPSGPLDLLDTHVNGLRGSTAVCGATVQLFLPSAHQISKGNTLSVQQTTARDSVDWQLRFPRPIQEDGSCLRSLCVGHSSTTCVDAFGSFMLVTPSTFSDVHVNFVDVDDTFVFTLGLTLTSSSKMCTFEVDVNVTLREKGFWHNVREWRQPFWATDHASAAPLTARSRLEFAWSSLLTTLSKWTLEAHCRLKKSTCLRT